VGGGGQRGGSERTEVVQEVMGLLAQAEALVGGRVAETLLECAEEAASAWVPRAIERSSPSI
jgi:hypothetical protein